MSKRCELAAALVLGALSACGGAPAPAVETSAEASTPPPLRRRSDVADDCAQAPGQSAPEPLRKRYSGVAADARCQREVYTIMGGLTHFLGVKCEYCHAGEDYEAPTHNKQVANWMASELIPSLEKKGGGKLWCNDCHAANDQATTMVLGNPRQQGFVIEWMSSHLTQRFERASDHRNLLCKDCHRAGLGSPDFQRKIILTDHLPPRPRALAPSTNETGTGGAPSPAEAPAPSPAEAPAPSPAEASPPPAEAPPSPADAPPQG